MTSEFFYQAFFNPTVSNSPSRLSSAVCASAGGGELQVNRQCFGRDIVLVRFDCGFQSVRRGNVQVDAVGHVKLGGLAQILHAADKLACQSLADEFGRQLGDQRSDVRALLGNREARLGLRVDFHFLGQDFKRLASRLDFERVAVHQGLRGSLGIHRQNRLLDGGELVAVFLSQVAWAVA